MTNPKIRVGAELDLSSIEAQIKGLTGLAEGVNKALGDGSVGVKPKEIEANLAGLEKMATKLAAALESAATSGKKLDPKVFSDASSALEKAATSAGVLEDVMTQMGKPSGMGASVKGARDMAQSVERAAKAHRDLTRDGAKFKDSAHAVKQRYDELRTSGARGTSRIRQMQFDDWASGGWENESVNPADARRKRRDVLRRIGVEMPGEERAEKGSSVARRIAGRWGGAAAGALTGVASGGGFGIGAIAGAAGGLIPGPAGLVAGPLLGAIGGIVDKGLERALSEATDLSDLRHSIGATKVDFEELRDRLHHFSNGLGLTYQESAKLARAFTHTANASGGTQVGQEVGQAAGFARGYGMDPNAAVQFFAVMRHYGSTQNERDSKRLALSIAEAVNKGGISAKADEALAAISNYVQSSTRASLTAANTEAFASYLSSLTGLSMYGMKGDPEAAASAMGKADAALRQGGGFGEASKNFSLGLYQRMMPGFTAFDMDYLNEQGAFGSVGRAFGRNSPAYALARDRGDRRKMGQYDQWAAAGGDQSILSLQMQALQQYFGGNTDGFRKAVQSQFGVGAGEASALYQAFTRDNGLGGLQKQLQGAGVDMTRLNTKQIASLAELAGASGDDLRKQATRLGALTGADRLSPEEAKALGEAVARGNDDELRKVVLSLSALHDSTADVGEKQRQLQADMANSLQEIAAKLIPIQQMALGAINELVKALAPESQYAQDAAVQEKNAASMDDQLAKLKVEIAKPEPTAEQRRARDKQMAGLHGIDFGGVRMKGPTAREAAISEYNTILQRRNALDKVAPSTHGAISAAGKEGAPAAPLGGPVSSAGGHIDGRGRRGPRNLRNNNPGNIEYGAFARSHGAVGTDGRFAIFPNRETGSRAMDALLQNYQKRHGLNTIYGIVSRWAPAKENNVAAYAASVARDMGVGIHQRLNLDDPDTVSKLARAKAKVEGSADAYVGPARRKTAANDSLKLPANDPGYGGQQLAAQTVQIDGRFMLIDRNGNEIGNAVSQVQTRVGAPMPAGTARA